MKNKLFILILLAPLFFACSSGKSMVKTSEKGLFTLEIILEGDNLVMGNNALKAILKDSKNEVLSGAVLEITPWMPAMGHGVMLIPTVLEKGKGMYNVKDVQISMEGLWQLKIRIIKDGSEDNLIFDFPDVKG